MKPLNTMPAFALEPAATWHDLHNAMIGCVEYQRSKLGKILPLMLFAPMMEPEILDVWEPPDRDIGGVGGVRLSLA